MTLEQLTEGSVYHRIVGNRIIMVYPRMFNTIITIGPMDVFIDDQW